MRARMAIVRTNFQVEHREVILRDRPEHMMQISPKGTVPVMLLPDGTVIEFTLFDWKRWVFTSTKKCGFKKKPRTKKKMKRGMRYA